MLGQVPLASQCKMKNTIIVWTCLDKQCILIDAMFLFVFSRA